MNPHYQQKRNIRQSCCHKFYPQPFLIPVFNFSHKRPTFAFTPESGYTLGSAQGIAHSGLHGETGAVSDGGGIITLDTSCTFTNIPGPGIRTANFAAFGPWPGALSKNAESLRDSDALMRVAVPRRRGPAGLRDLFRFCRNCGVYALRSGLSACARHGWYHYPRCALCAAETPDGRMSKRLICRFLGLTGSSLIPAAQNTVLFGHGIPTEKRLNRQRLIPPPAGRCGSNTAVSRSPGLSRGPRCPAPARTPQVSAPAP